MESESESWKPYAGAGLLFPLPPMIRFHLALLHENFLKTNSIALSEELSEGFLNSCNSIEIPKILHQMHPGGKRRTALANDAVAVARRLDLRTRKGEAEREGGRDSKLDFQSAADQCGGLFPAASGLDGRRTGRRA